MKIEEIFNEYPQLKEKQNNFFQKFKSFSGRYYIYDTNTNQIAEVDEIIYNIIELWKKGLSSEECERVTGFEKQQILRAQNLIEEYHIKHNLFSNHRPKEMSWPYDESLIRKQLDTGIKHLILTITEDCNLRCKYCTYSGLYFYERTRSKKHIPYDVAKKSIDYFAKHCVKDEPIISFFGGEPLLKLDLVKQLVDYIYNIKDWKPVFHIETNGVLLTEDVIRFLATNNFYIQISLDGPAEVHDKYRVFENNAGSFDIITNNINSLKRLYPDYFKSNVMFIATTAPPEDLVKVDEFYCGNFKNHKPILIFVNSYDTKFFEKFKEETLSSILNKTSEILTDEYIKLRSDSKISFIPGIKTELYEKTLIRIHMRDSHFLSHTVAPKGLCIPGTKRLYANCEGEFFPCERVGELGIFRLGDAYNGISYDRVINLIKEFIKISSNICLDCWAVRLCGTCFATARFGGNLTLERKLESCQEIISKIKKAFAIYATIIEKNPNGFDFVKQMRFK